MVPKENSNIRETIIMATRNKTQKSSTKTEVKEKKYAWPLEEKRLSVLNMQHQPKQDQQVSLTAFKLTDNDFQVPLQRAIEQVFENMEEPLSVENMHKCIVYATNAHSNIRRLTNNSVLKDRTEYLKTKITVFELNTMQDLPRNFEGFVYLNKLMTVEYVEN